MNYGEGLSASDVALLTDGRNNNGGFGDGNGWWVIIFLIFAMMGWGRNGFGNGFGGNDGNWSPCCTPATQQGLSDAMNFSQLDNSVRGVQQGLCDGFYAVNTSILNLGQTLLNCCCEVKTGIMQDGYETRSAINSNSNAIQGQLCQGFNGVNQGINNLGFKLQDCCCDIERGIDGVNYNMAKNTCDIVRAGQDNTQRILDFLQQDKIDQLRQQVIASNEALNNVNLANRIVNEIKPCPIPAYLTCSPYTSYSPYGFNGFGFDGFNRFGFNNGCCGSNCGCC